MRDFIDADDGARLFLHTWAVDDPVLTVAILHGYGEHAGRYAHVAKALNERRVSVVGGDFRGHGRSDGRRSYVASFFDYHRDASAIVTAAKEVAPSRPLAVFAHSMGALVTLDWLRAGHGRDLVGVALSSPLLGVAVDMNPLKLWAGRLLSRFSPTVNMATGIRGVDVTRDPDMAAACDRDPLRNKVGNVRWYTETLAAIDRVLAHAPNYAMPLLLLYAGADRIVSAHATERFASRLTMKDRVVERLPEYFHEIVNDPPEARAKIIGQLASWFVERAATQAS